ncbi:BufA1 family periplasmic bufferin-type metallophore [Candidatus Berkiella aquae]|uniref:DUF2282 domain-containing protein n=1 Tax=Candidatus Berkiella aquae TaxID=295108 RepID=A0A0Q9YZ68_9GAMM|nr:DUF2282 domain-containing protein [Candidatus Berkiella aquae]MCS5712529.1 DUF2282 domain-containing protein [Candidatus Berkiella aquae]
MDFKVMMQSALGAALALGVSTNSVAGPSQVTAKTINKDGLEKCYGIVKSGFNDCGADIHACATQSAKDGDPNDWLYMPKGMCEKIIGGKTK